MQNLTPFLRRKNRIQTIHASLAIENNTLSLDQATALLNGERVRGSKKEIQEVKNAFEVYENLDDLNPFSEEDFLKAHQTLMNTLIPKEGHYR